MTLLERLSLLWRRFSPLEERLLEAARGALSPSARRTFDAQVSAITRVQRHPDWTEIAFYRMRAGRVDWSDVPRFPRRGELPLVEVRFRAAGRAFKARLTAVDGHVFDFGVTPSPRRAAFVPWEAEPDVRLLFDPEDAHAEPPAEPLPDEWRALVEEGPATHPEWVLLGPAEVHRVTMDEGEFLVLAEARGAAFLLWRLEPGPGAFLLQTGHDGAPAVVTRADVRRVLGTPPPVR